MRSLDDNAVVDFTVREVMGGGKYNVFESGFDQPLAQFDDLETAEKYVRHVAVSKASWKVGIFDGTGRLASTFSSEDDVTPKH